MERVFIQIDGSNFYHRLKESPVKLQNLLQFDFAAFGHKPSFGFQHHCSISRLLVRDDLERFVVDEAARQK